MPSLTTSVTRITTAGFSYDATGNLTSDVTSSYAWNAESEIKTANSVNYTYDGDGNRVQKSNGKIYWYGAGTEILDESDASGNFTDEYVFFGGKRVAHRSVSSGNIFYYAEDMLGSSRAMVQAGQTSVCYDADFYPYGGEKTFTSTCPQNYKFEGKERDTETGNDDFGARYYSSVYGRFISPDWSAKPQGVPYADFGDPQSLNLYGFVKNNPLRNRDEDGHCVGPVLYVCVVVGVAAVAWTFHEILEWGKKREAAENKAFQKSYDCAMKGNCSSEKELRSYDQERLNTYVQGGAEAIKSAFPSAMPPTTLTGLAVDQLKGAAIDKMIDSAKKENDQSQQANQQGKDQQSSSGKSAPDPSKSSSPPPQPPRQQPPPPPPAKSCPGGGDPNKDCH